MARDELLTEDRTEDGILTLGLNRAPVNALSPDFLMHVADRLEAAADDDEVRALVISSAFKVFSAGLDLKEAQNFDLADQNAIVAGLNIAFSRLFAFPKPTVAAVDGAAIAGGLFFVLASDFRVAGPRAKFGLAEVRVGATFPVGPLEIARATLTPDLLRRLMLTGQPMSAEQAAAAGMVDVLTEGDQVMERSVEAARGLAGSPPGTYAAVKTQIRGSVIADIEEAMAQGANAPEGGWFNAETKAAMAKMIG